MATKKATKKSTAAKSASAKTTAKRTGEAKAAAEKAATTKSTVISSSRAKTRLLPDNIPNIMLAEVIGTFILTLVAVASIALGELFVGLTLATMVLVIGGISGSHINPAVTFGFWTMRKINWATGLLYWAAQFVGALLALAVMFLLSNNTMTMNFANFATFDWAVFGAEMVAMAVFMFGLAATVSRTGFDATAKAMGIGMSLLLGLLVGSTLLGSAKEGAYAAYQKEAEKIAQNADAKAEDQPKTPHAIHVKSVVVNPAVALAATEVSESQLMGGSSGGGESTPNRFGLEVIFATLVGAAVGGNLYLLLNRRIND